MTETCACGHHSHLHQSDPSGMHGSPCWESLDGKTDEYGYPINVCPCSDYNPAGGHQMTEHPNYPHTSWNTAESRAQAHSNNNTVFGRLPSIVTVETLTQHCPVEQGRDYCAVCCAVSTDTTAGAG